MQTARTQVGIVGAGPAGLMLGHLLHLRGIDSVILERPQPGARHRARPRRRARAGHGRSDDRRSASRERLRARGHAPRRASTSPSAARRHRIDMAELTGGRAITIYGQNEVVKDLIDARLGDRAAAAVRGRSRQRARPRHRAAADRVSRTTAQAHELVCDVIAGCDGFHGVCRPAIPAGAPARLRARLPVRVARHSREARRRLRRARLQPARPRLRAVQHAVAGASRGCICSARRTRTSTTGRDDRIWAELIARLATADGWAPNDGPILQKGVTGMRSFVAEPMRYGRLFLAGTRRTSCRRPARRA